MQNTTHLRQTALDLECSRCGAKTDHGKDVFCIANTKWGYDEKLPVLTPALIRSTTWETEVDEKKQWHLALCDSCLIKSYRYHLSTAIKGSFETLSIFGFFSAVICFLFILAVIFNWDATIGTLFGLGFLGTGVIALLSGLAWLGDRHKLNKANKVTILPDKEFDSAFVGEAERIRDSMEAGRTDFYGSFELPQFSTDSRKGRVKGMSFRSISLVSGDISNTKT